MSKVKDLTGQRFGRLIALKRQKGSRRVIAKWECQCDCGRITLVSTYKLTSGHTNSCGCLQRERTSNATTKHGMKRTRLYGIWCNLRERCYNPKNQSYAVYGGRGITVCDAWRTDFPAFYDWAMKNGYRDDLTIDRINNDDGYCPNNCRWATNKEQQRNKRNTIWVTIGEETRALADWCEIFNKDYQSAYDALIRYKRLTPTEYFAAGV